MKTPKYDNSRKLSFEVEAVVDLLKILRDQGADDEEMKHDAIEGETNLLEAVQIVMKDIDECEAHIMGLKCKQSEYETRIKIISDRRDRLKTAIEQAMIRTEIDTLRLDVAALSIRNTAPKLIVENEAEIPSNFWVASAPKLDRAALSAALKNEPVQGASLSNGGVTLSIRRK